MPKQKTHKGIAKKVTVRPGGSRKGSVLSKADTNRYKKAL